MKGKLFAFLAAAALCVGSVGMAQAQNPVRASIPFDFVVSGKTMPSGTYVFQQALPNSVRTLAVHDGKGHGAMAWATTQDYTELGEKLVFRKHGDEYFLSDIYSPSGRLHFTAGRSESKLSKATDVTTVSIPVAGE